MKQVIEKVGIAALLVGGVLVSLLTAVDVSGSGTIGTNTRKVDRHITRLSQHEWFKILLEDERYTRSFMVNRKVRKHLESSLRIYLLEKSEREQKKFKRLLEKWT